MTQVQDHANDRSVALSVKATKITARFLAQTMQAFLRRSKNPAQKHGKQSLKSLTKQNAAIENIPISNENIGSFKKIARKYNIDFSLKKDSSAEPPNWIVFFKAKDGKTIEAAFKEFSKEVLKEKVSKPSAEKGMGQTKETKKVFSPLAPAKSRNESDIEL